MTKTERKLLRDVFGYCYPNKFGTRPGSVLIRGERELKVARDLESMGLVEVVDRSDLFGGGYEVKPHQYLKVEA